MSTCERCWQLGGSTAEGYAAELLKYHDSQHDLLARAEKAEASLAAAEAKLADEVRHAEAIVKAADDLCSRGLWPDTLLRYETAKSARRAGKAAVEREEGKR